MFKFALGAVVALGWREFGMVSPRGAKAFFVSRPAEFASGILTRVLSLALVFCVLSLSALLVGSALGRVVVLYRSRSVTLVAIVVHNISKQVSVLISTVVIYFLNQEFDVLCFDGSYTPLSLGGCRCVGFGIG